MTNLLSVYNIPINNITNMCKTYMYCINLTGSPVCGNNVIDMSNAYYDCRNLTGSPICGDNVINMYQTYNGCHNLTGSPACGPNVTNMHNTYYNCYNLTGNPVCGDNVTNMSGTYNRCFNLTGSPVCGNKVTDMYSAYEHCHNLTGSPVCGPNVTNMCGTYYGCSNLTGNPVCGDNVIDMSGTYEYCTNLTGSPVCGNNVTNMSGTYYNCYNLTGTAIIGPKVSDVKDTYYNCSNITNIISYAIEPPIISANTFYNIPSSINIYVPVAGKEKYESAWASYANYVSRLQPIEKVYVYPIKSKMVLFNVIENISVKYYLADTTEFQVDVTTDNESIVSISNISHDNDNIYFTTTTHEIEGSVIINITITTEEASHTSSYKIDVYETIPQNSYTIEAVEGVEYGFSLNENGYYESENVGVNSSYAICKIKINSYGINNLYLDCINSSEFSYDFGLLSEVNAPLSLDYETDTDNVFKSFRGINNTNIQSIDYGVLPAGEHYIYVKYKKDFSDAQGRDSLQFKVRFE